MLILTGTGHCGTGYVAALLNACGVRCGHQEVFPGAGAPDWRALGRLDAESSFGAAPYLPLAGAQVVHVVRHPLHTLRSWEAKTQRAGREWMAATIGVPAPPEPDRAFWSAIWTGWNKLIAPNADLTWRLEDGGQALCDRLGLTPHPSFDLRAKVNPHSYGGPLPPASDLSPECRELARSYGYDM